jgi:hypothetical protein
MTKNEFKHRWESNDDGGGITFDDIAACAIDWGMCSNPRTHAMLTVTYKVLRAANTNDAENYAPNNEENN